MPQTDVERLAVLIEANTKSYERAMTRMERKTDTAVRKSTKAVSRLDKSLGRASRTALTLAKSFAGAFGGALAVGGITGIAGAVRDVTSEMAKLAENADKVGLSIEELQLVRAAGEEMGIAYGQADTAMQRFSRRIAEASTGAGELVKILNANNLELRDQEGNLRPQIDILKDYADLIKNAGSEQEQLLLAFKAFDTEGASFVNVLRDGAGGLEEVFDRQRELNNLFDEETVRTMKEVDQSFTDFSNTLATNTKRAIVSIIEDVRALGDEMESFSSKLGGFLTENFGFFEDAETRARGALKLKLQLLALENSTGGLDPGEFAGIRPPPGSSDPGGSTTIPARTVIPGAKTSGRSGADRQAERIQNVVRALEFQAEQLQRTSEQQAVYNQLKVAGVSLDSEAGQKIETLTLNLEDAQRKTKALEDAQESASRSAEFFGESLVDGVLAISSGAEKATDVVKRLALSLADAALKAALFDTGPLAGLFGGSQSASKSAGGFIGSLLKSLPGFATGGNFTVGGSGGTDSQLVAFRATPGESVSVTPPRTPQGGNDGMNINVRFFSTDGNEVEGQKSKTSGGLDFVVAIDRVVGDAIGRRGSRTRGALESSFGLSNPLAGR